MSLRTAMTALRERRRQRRVDAAVADHGAARAVRRTAATPAPTTRNVAIGGQTGSTVA